MALSYGTKNPIGYGFAYGKLSVIATRKLDSALLEQMLVAEDLLRRIKLLDGYLYAPYLKDVESASEINAALDACLEDTYEWLEKAYLDPQIEEYFRTRFNYENLAAVLQARSIGRTDMPALNTHGTWSAGEVEKRAVEFMAAGDNTVERAMYAELLDIAKKSKIAFLTEVTRSKIDGDNIKVMMRLSHRMDEDRFDRVRAREMFEAVAVPGGHVTVGQLASILGSASALTSADRAEDIVKIPYLRRYDAARLAEAKTLDVALIAPALVYIARGSRAGAGPELVIAYIMRIEMEITMLRIVLLGTDAGINPEELRGLLVAPQKR